MLLIHPLGFEKNEQECEELYILSMKVELLYCWLVLVPTKKWIANTVAVCQCEIIYGSWRYHRLQKQSNIKRS